MKAIKLVIIHILKILAFLAVPLFVYLFIVNSSLTAISPQVGIYSPSDEETNYLAALSIYRGEGLYQNFSISYPPGRFIAQTLFFHITSPTIISARIYMNLFAPLLFPVLLFFLTYRIVGSYLLAWLALLLDLTLIHSAQEVHVLIAAFGLILLSNIRWRSFFLGLFLGLIFLFRFEAGIIVTLSLFITYRTLSTRSSILGFILVWLPVLLNLLTHGTLFNFLYDIIVLGLITQPAVMGEAIPPNGLWYAFLSSLIALFGLALSLATSANKPLRVIAGVALLSYVSALGRSDEGHLWYALIWLPLLVSYAITQLGRFRLLPTIYMGIALFTLSYLIITIKSPVIFLLAGSLFLVIAPYLSKYSREFIISGIITSLLVFHSFAYFTLRFQLPRYSGAPAHPWTQIPSDRSIGGLDFSPPTIATLKELKSKITGDNPHLFIFPENTIYYEYFRLPRPTRYTYLIGERTAKTESEIISDLESTSNLYVMVFPDKAAQRGGAIWSWIQSNTNIISTDPYQDNLIELRH